MARTWLWSADRHFVHAFMAAWGTAPATVLRCELCDMVIVSQHRHHMNGCACPELSRVWIDGGTDYLRIMWGPSARFTEHISAPAERET